VAPVGLQTKKRGAPLLKYVAVCLFRVARPEVLPLLLQSPTDCCFNCSLKMKQALQLAALGCLLVGADAKALKWGRDDSASWTPAKETMGAIMNMGMNWSPAPTSAPDPEKVKLELEKRVRGDNTCAFVGGRSSRWNRLVKKNS
jgi:hypothetical protein